MTFDWNSEELARGAMVLGPGDRLTDAGLRAVMTRAVELFAARTSGEAKRLNQEELQQAIVWVEEGDPKYLKKIEGHIAALEAELFAARAVPTGQVAEDVAAIDTTLRWASGACPTTCACPKHAALSRLAAAAQRAEALEKELNYASDRQDSSDRRARRFRDERDAALRRAEQAEARVRELVIAGQELSAAVDRHIDTPNDDARTLATLRSTHWKCRCGEPIPFPAIIDAVQEDPTL